MTEIRLSTLAKGLASFVPGIGRLTCSGSGGTVSARYCYSVWLRILVKLHSIGVRPNLHSVAELGPGDSLGVGLCAMLSGANHYYALDAKKHATSPRNAEILEECITLFKSRSTIPDDTEFPRVTPKLESYEFPRWLFTGDSLNHPLSESRLERLRKLLSGKTIDDADLSINYVAPWDDRSAIPGGTLDFLFSQAVMEHVDEPSKTYACMSAWLRQGGLSSHAIDFKSHGLTRHWYGHWTASSGVWRLVRGTRPYLINRLPCSAHLRMLSEHGFEIVLDERTRAEAPPLQALANEFMLFEKDDYETAACFVVVRKK
jgi:hypothetical protein